MIETDVLISGLGPVGATLANLLGQQGIRTLAVERDTTVYPLPRAAHFDAEIMRVWQGLGLLDQAMKVSRLAPAYEFRTAKGEALLHYDLGDVIVAPGFQPSWMFNQPDLERALRAKLSTYPTVETRLGVRLEGFEASNQGVTGTIVDAHGKAEQVRAKYLVACDGASSMVRKALKIEHFDYGFDEPWLVVDAQVKRPEKMPALNLQIARIYNEQGEIDKALESVKAAQAAGDDKAAVAGIATAIGDKLRKQYEGDKNKETGLRAIEVLKMAESVQPSEAIYFLTGLLQFQIGAAILQEANTAKSCDGSKEAKNYLTDAEINLPKGGRQFGPQLAQVLPQLQQMNTYPDQMIKAYCK